MSEPLFTLTLAGRTYELASLTLGEMRVMKQQFGLARIDELSPTDPDHLVGLFYTCLRRDGVTPEAALAQAEGIDFIDFADAAEADGKAETDEAPPPPKRGRKAKASRPPDAASSPSPEAPARALS